MVSYLPNQLCRCDTLSPFVRIIDILQTDILLVFEKAVEFGVMSVET